MSALGGVAVGTGALLLALGLVKFIPYLGVWAWTAATLIGVGATLTTKLGRREPWFQEALA